jgi:hypothetical protein
MIGSQMNLKKFHIANSQISGGQLNSIIDNLSTYTSERMESIDFSGCNFESKTFSLLSGFIKKSSHLKNINLSKLKMGSYSAKILYLA